MLLKERTFQCCSYVRDQEQKPETTFLSVAFRLKQKGLNASDKVQEQRRLLDVFMNVLHVESTSEFVCLFIYLMQPCTYVHRHILYITQGQDLAVQK